VTFADGLPLPLPMKGRKIENRLFTYTSDYRLEDRTVKVRREFASRVPGQACAPEIEAQIAGPLKAVHDDLMTRMRMPAAPGPSAATKAPVPEPRAEIPAPWQSEPRVETPEPRPAPRADAPTEARPPPPAEAPIQEEGRYRRRQR
jgi:hypothetical protein